ncbi:MAG TPA: pitrilysin family protein [Spirochaetota bacterium]|nr:pitrilysin family protein [Spirochaetota bacterium]HPC42278.1 pitrilysin family protein [Spirochaetota bacterium]HPL16650.1 pitrilysin family protein [Spirochaetota bacterium]HQF09984.1 pitrilysin family protein [Spirochaetota bacterium]HQH98688.1 pitrilysin family protein [Spirochaetota bacterium]
MKRVMTMAILIVLALFWDAGRPASAQFSPDAIRLPPVETAVLANGIRLFYIRDELPQVTVMASIGFGKLYEKKENAGISDVIAKAISLGGSVNYPGSVLHEKVDAMGGRLSVESSWEGTVISLKVLERFRGEAFAIVADLVASPVFDQRSLDTAKGLVADSIRRKYDDPAEIAFDRVRDIIFGGEGYGSSPTPEKVAAYTIEDVKGVWEKYRAGRNIMIGISSSIGFAEAGRLCRERFSAIAPGGDMAYTADRESIRARVKASRGKIYFYPKDIPQSTVIVGTVAPEISYGGGYALEIMNFILGGGSFNSRLMTEIRVKRGLAYAVQSILKLRSGTGVFLAFAQVENRTLGEALGLLNENIDRISHEKISGAEMEWARKAITNSFVFQFDTPMNVLSNYLFIAYNNLPPDYFTGYLGRINGVRDGEVLAETAKLFEPGLVTVVVGNESVLPDLKKFGEVVIIK